MSSTEILLRRKQPAYGTDEVSVWCEFQKGSRAAFSFIYQKYSDNLYRYGMHLVDNENLVEDAIQDLFVNLWRRKENLTAVISIRCYLLACLRRSILKTVKKESRFASGEDVMNRRSFEFSPSVEDDLVDEQICRDRRLKVSRILRSLSQRQREIIYLKFYEDLSYSEIAEHLGLDLKYTCNVASRAFCLIRKQYSLFALISFAVPGL